MDKYLIRFTWLACNSYDHHRAIQLVLLTSIKSYFSAFFFVSFFFKIALALKYASTSAHKYKSIMLKCTIPTTSTLWLPSFSCKIFYTFCISSALRCTFIEAHIAWRVNVCIELIYNVPLHLHIYIYRLACISSKLNTLSIYP